MMANVDSVRVQQQCDPLPNYFGHFFAAVKCSQVLVYRATCGLCMRMVDYVKAYIE